MDASSGILQQSFLSVAKREWLSWLSCAIVAFFAASLLISGWPQGWIPEIVIPYTYSGDGMSYLWNIKRVIEGAWYFENVHTGFPFGSNHLDYPTSDTGSYLVLKIIGTIFHSAVAAANLYYLLGFALCAAVTYIVSRTLGISRRFAVVNSLLYALTSFHFGRIGHLFFTWYFVAPLFFYFGFKLFAKKVDDTGGSVGLKGHLLDGIALVVLASFGIYYALFGCMVLFVCGVLAAAMHRSWRYVWSGVCAVGFVVLGVLLNVAPSLVYLMLHGENREGVSRLAAESELYALKITQMLLPRADHRLESFYEFAGQYNTAFPLITENISASLGVIGSTGFLLLVGVVFISPMLSYARKFNAHNPKVVWHGLTVPIHQRLMVLSLLALCLVLMATVGGFSSLFAMVISTSIRSWNRISIFIGFLSVTAFVLMIDWLVQNYVKPAYQVRIGIALAGLILVFGVLDQTAKPCHTCTSANQTLFENDKNFIQTIEKELPKDAAIYQLPYVAYPENGAINGLGSYDQARGHLHSEHLNWSFGGMRGREGDWFYRKLAQLPFDQQVAVVKAIGFAGIYVDRRGYMGATPDKRCAALAALQTDIKADTPADSQVNRIKNDCLSIIEVEQGISDALSRGATPNVLRSQDNMLSFFKFEKTDANLKTLAVNIVQINSYLNPIGFEWGKDRPVFSAAFDGVIDFRKSDFPSYLGSVTGLSGISSVNGLFTGRWSDAYRAKRVTLWLAKPLPAKFSLIITAQAGGPNAGQPLQIKVGKQIKDVVFDAKFETKTVTFETTAPIYKIEFKPFLPFSPARRWGSDDTRLLGVEFQKIAIDIQK